jgi:hypothetical protein
MTTENQQCDYCGKVTTSYSKKIEQVNGLYLEIGYSYGGWGRRGNFIKDSVEICVPCFNMMKSAIDHLIETKQALKNPKNFKK